MTGRGILACFAGALFALAVMGLLLPPPVPGMDCAPRRLDDGPCVRRTWVSGFQATVCPAGSLPLDKYPPSSVSIYQQGSLTMGDAVWWN